MKLKKIVPQLDQQGYVIGVVVADPSPLEPGVYLIPGGAVDAEPPVVTDGMRAKWNGAGFDLENIPRPALEPLPTVDELKARAWEKIKAERSSRKAGGVKVGEYWFHTDDASRIQYGILDGKATRAALPGNAVLHPEWKTMSGVKTPMTVALLRQVLDAGIASEAVIFDAAETHKAAMEASADPAAYDFSTGWPAIYVPVIK